MVRRSVNDEVPPDIEGGDVTTKPEEAELEENTKTLRGRRGSKQILDAAPVNLTPEMLGNALRQELGR